MCVKSILVNVELGGGNRDSVFVFWIDFLSASMQWGGERKGGGGFWFRSDGTMLSGYRQADVLYCTQSVLRL